MLVDSCKDKNFLCFDILQRKVHHVTYMEGLIFIYLFVYLFRIDVFGACRVIIWQLSVVLQTGHQLCEASLLL